MVRNMRTSLLLLILSDMALVETGMRLKSEDSSVSINKEMLEDKFKTEDALSAFEHKFQGCVFFETRT